METYIWDDDFVNGGHDNSFTYRQNLIRLEPFETCKYIIGTDESLILIKTHMNFHYSNQPFSKSTSIKHYQVYQIGSINDMKVCLYGEHTISSFIEEKILTPKIVDDELIIISHEGICSKVKIINGQ